MKLFLPFLAIFPLALSSPVQPREPRKCNLNPAVCDRPYTNVSYIGTHNSAFHGDIDDPRVNQHLTVTQQLDAGVRFLQAQVHEWLGMLRMCHTECVLLDAGSLADYLGEVKGWMEAHAEEVVTLLLVNGDNTDVGQFAEVFESTGIEEMAYVPPTSPEPLGYDDWPTLAELIDAKTPLVTFLSSSADEASVPYLLSEFDHYFFETPFETTDPTFPSCELHRPAAANAEGRMYIMNHFLQDEVLPDVFIPAVDENHETNAATGEGSIGAQVKLCEEKWGRKPNFVLVDQFQRGDVWAAQAAVNGF